MKLGSLTAWLPGAKLPDAYPDCITAPIPTMALEETPIDSR